MTMMTGRRLGATLLLVAMLLTGGSEAARESKISATKHNLSATGTGTTHSSTESQICVFCHTPHGADASQAAPLWNKTLANAAYSKYTSSSLDAATIAGAQSEQPLGSSKLCLSCHDGVMALGSVRAVRGQANQVIGGGTEVAMPAGPGASTGYTRLLGTDLTNDHPISVTFDQALADRDGEMRAISASPTNRWGTTVGVRGKADSYKPMLPLEPTGSSNAGQVQCTTCHDAHIRETNSGTTGTGEGNIKFLRGNRFQKVQPTADYSAANDIVCLACHDKAGNSWAYSAHANSNVATQTYLSAAATTRDFPKSGDAGITADLPVWKAACLNCHDSHTVQGARRLLREGTSGGNSAIEETCYQCHSASGTSIITPLTTIPNIKTDFTTSTIRMPIATTSEAHDISGNFNDATFVDCTGSTNKCGKDFMESRAKLGLGNAANRHAECTDCHNPHRVVKFKDFRGSGGSITGAADASGTHKHTDDATDIHTNIASGVLRGSWGVEPTYSSMSFHVLPSGYNVKRGDPAGSATANVGDTYVTREYQICLKCHSDYGYSDDNVYPSGTNRPPLGGANLTAQNANGHTNFTRYTNQAKEFQAPSTHAVANGSVSKGTEAGNSKAASNANNHRSWHPVMAPTGRTGRSGAWIRPWNNSGTGGKAGRLGVQTMYCSDCHGSDTGATTGSPALGTVIPTGGENGNPWGPHGSSNNFLLKGQWDTGSGEGNNNTLCFKCHSQAAYSGGGGTGWSTDKGDGHNVHSNRIDNPLRCNWCHVAVPHGWKNRNLLVNLNDVGAEAGLAAGTAVTFTNNVGYTNGPYYRRAFQRITSFPSGQWTESNCNGGRDGMKTNCETAN